MSRLKALITLAGAILAALGALLIVALAGPSAPAAGELGAVFVGVLAGIAAGIPTSGLLLFVLTRPARYSRAELLRNAPGRDPATVQLYNPAPYQPPAALPAPSHTVEYD